MTPSQQNYVQYYFPSPYLSQNGHITITDDVLNVWNHIAFCYDAGEKIFRSFLNGQLDLEITNYTPTNALTTFEPYFSNNSIIDEFRFLDGICAWTEDFTPPTEPY